MPAKKKTTPKPKTAVAKKVVAKKVVAKKVVAKKVVAKKVVAKKGAGKVAPVRTGSLPEVGSKAPSFALADEKGAVLSSSSLSGKPYLLYFYPKDDTPGCTTEACDVRDSFARFGKQGLRVLGVSPDSVESHARFSKKYGLPFTLLSDPETSLANAYGVWQLKENYGRKYMGVVRSTFLVGSDGRIKKTYRGVKVPGHVEAVLSDAHDLL